MMTRRTPWFDVLVDERLAVREITLILIESKIKPHSLLLTIKQFLFGFRWSLRART